MPITIKKIADYAGVSIGTVSRALNNDSLIAEKTRKKIKELADELDYVPNSIGKGLQSNKSYLVGYLLSDIKDSFYDEILQGIGTIVNQNNYGLLLGISENNSKNEIEQLKIFREKAVDGIIISNYHKETIPYIEKIEKSGIPVVLSDIEPFNNKIPSVRINDVKASEITMEYLNSHGHKRIAYCFAINSNSINRYNACLSWAAHNNTPAPILYQDMLSLIKILNTAKAPTAIICYSDKIAIEIIQKLNFFGVRIPEDISIVGFDNITAAQWPEFQLTTINQPKTELGKLSASLLFNKIKDEQDIDSVIIEPELIVRTSSNKIK